MRGTGKGQSRLNPPLLEEKQRNLTQLIPPCSHSQFPTGHCSQSLSPILPLACLQPAQCTPTPSNKYISFDLINIDFASHREREGEPKSLRNRRHQENIMPKSPCTIMLSFMFLFLVLLESFILFLAHPPNFQLHLHLTLLISRADTCVYIQSGMQTSAPVSDE